MAAPVAVRAVPLLDAVVEPLADGVGVADVAAAVWTAGACGWNARTLAVPATVAAMTMGDRRIGDSALRFQKVKDSKWIRGCGTPARSSSAASWSASPSGPHR